MNVKSEATVVGFQYIGEIIGVTKLITTPNPDNLERIHAIVQDVESKPILVQILKSTPHAVGKVIEDMVLVANPQVKIDKIRSLKPQSPVVD